MCQQVTIGPLSTTFETLLSFSNFLVVLEWDHLVNMVFNGFDGGFDEFAWLFNETIPLYSHHQPPSKVIFFSDRKQLQLQRNQKVNPMRSQSEQIQMGPSETTTLAQKPFSPLVEVPSYAFPWDSKNL